MPIRVDRPGVQAILDPVGAGGTGGGTPVYDDGQRDPWADRPWQGKEGFAVSRAAVLARTPAEELAAVRPEQPQQLFPPEFGYDQTPVTIEQVLDIPRWAPNIRSWTSPWMRSPERADYDSQIQAGPTPAMSSSPFG